MIKENFPQRISNSHFVLTQEKEAVYTYYSIKKLKLSKNVHLKAISIVKHIFKNCRFKLKFSWICTYKNEVIHKSKYLKYCWELNVNMFDTEKVGSLTCMEKKIK